MNNSIRSVSFSDDGLHLLVGQSDGMVLAYVVCFVEKCKKCESVNYCQICKNGYVVSSGLCYEDINVTNTTN